MKRLLMMFLSISQFIRCQESQNLRPWVKQTSIIYVRLQALNIFIDVPINDKTNVIDIKKHIRRDYNIPTENQAIHPYLKRWWTLWLSEWHGSQLRNDELIKKVMNEQNTKTFELHDTRKHKELN